jgi:glycosyltransferase involved in cell wall biosynthesis
MTARAYGLTLPPGVVHNGRRQPTGHETSRDGVFAFTAGRLWDEGKNVAAIDRAAARLHIPILAAGDIRGPNGVFVDTDHVWVLGRINDMEIEHYLSAKPIFVSAALYEPFGLAVLEAAQAGCALVLADIPTFRELWNGAATFVTPEDDEALAKAIDNLARDTELRAHLGSLAREKAAAYTVNAMSAGVLATYRSLLPSNACRPPVEEAAA